MMDIMSVTIIGILGSACVLLLIANRRVADVSNRLEFREQELMKKLDIAERELKEEKREHENSKKATEDSIKEKQGIIDTLTKNAKKPRPGFIAGKGSSLYQRPQE